MNPETSTAPKTAAPKATETMTNELAAKREAIALLLAKANLDDSEAKYRIGEEVRAVMSDPERYGKRGVATIAQSVSCTAALLYSYAKVAEHWDEVAFGAMLDRKDKNGQPLSFSHCIALADVRQAKQREELMEKALAESLSCRKLAQLCRGAAGGKRRKRAAGDVFSALQRSSSAAVERVTKDLETLRTLTVEPRLANDAQVALISENCKRAAERFTELEHLVAALIADAPNQKAAE